MAESGFEPAEVMRRLTARLKLRHLNLLLMIRKHGSLTRVAEQMSTSQPAVTSALAELEGMFGAPLFVRSVRGMSPTPLGEVALARASAMLQDLDHLVRDMAATASGMAAHLNIGVIPFVSGQLISGAISATLPMERRISATLTEGTSEQLLGQLRDHSLDAVIGRAQAATGMQDLQFVPLYRQRPRLVASRRLAARLTRGVVQWDDLTDLDWVLGTRSTPMREQVADLFLRAGLPPPEPLVESNSAKLVGEIVAASERAVSVVPADIADELVRIAGVTIVPFTFEWTLAPIALFTRADSEPRPVDRLFGDALSRLCVQIYGPIS